MTTHKVYADQPKGGVPGLQPGQLLRVEVVVYADDVTVLLTGADRAALDAHAQRVLDRLSAWEVANGALVSLEKTTATVFRPGTGRNGSTPAGPCPGSSELITVWFMLYRPSR